MCMQRIKRTILGQPFTVEKGQIVANENLEISVLNMLGVEVWKGALKSGEHISLSSGIYLVKISTAKGAMARKIVI